MDIVEKLRSNFIRKSWELEAADEIEHLRSVLAPFAGALSFLKEVGEDRIKPDYRLLTLEDLLLYEVDFASADTALKHPSDSVQENEDG